MATSIFGDGLWGFVVVGGFIILGAAIAYAMLRNRRTLREERHTERATKDLYQEQDASDRADEAQR